MITTSTYISIFFFVLPQKNVLVLVLIHLSVFVLVLVLVLLLVCLQGLTR